MDGNVQEQTIRVNRRLIFHPHTTIVRSVRKWSTIRAGRVSFGGIIFGIDRRNLRRIESGSVAEVTLFVRKKSSVRGLREEVKRRASGWGNAKVANRKKRKREKEGVPSRNDETTRGSDVIINQTKPVRETRDRQDVLLPESTGRARHGKDIRPALRRDDPLFSFNLEKSLVYRGSSDLD